MNDSTDEKADRFQLLRRLKAAGKELGRSLTTIEEDLESRTREEIQAAGSLTLTGGRGGSNLWDAS